MHKNVYTSHGRCLSPHDSHLALSHIVAVASRGKGCHGGNRGVRVQPKSRPTGISRSEGVLPVGGQNPGPAGTCRH